MLMFNLFIPNKERFYLNSSYKVVDRPVILSAEDCSGESKSFLICIALSHREITVVNVGTSKYYKYTFRTLS